MASLLRADATYYRFLVLAFNCLLTFGSYFCFDMPSVLQTKFTTDSDCPLANVTSNITKNETLTCGCPDCLGMSDNQYNLLYAIYAWTNAVVVIFSGYLVDKLGNRFGVFLFSGLCVVGSTAFAVGAMFPGSTVMLPLMLIGRLLFGSGNGSLTIVQNRITAFWFREKELAMAFGITLAFSRLGSVLNFLGTESFANKYTVQLALWGGTILCGLGFLSAIIVSSLDKYGVKQIGQAESMKADSKKVKFTDIKHFSLKYWLLALMIMFFYNGVFPFVADASKFIQVKYNMKDVTASYIAGAAYDVSMILSPLLGWTIDLIGLRGKLALLCAILTIPVFGLLAFTTVYPLIPILWLGVTYSFAASTMWPSIPLVVSHATLGTAMGLTTSLQMIGIGISNLVVGGILGKSSDWTLPKNHHKVLKKFNFVMIFLLANALACVVTAVLLNIVDWRQGGILNENKAQRKARQELEKEVGGDKDGDEDAEPTETDPLLPAADKHSVNC